MEDRKNNIETMGKFIVIASVKYSPGIYIFSFFEKEKQREFYETIKITGRLPEKNGSLEVNTAYEATIEKSFLSSVQIDHPLSVNLN
jgi:hypothetical protein